MGQSRYGSIDVDTKLTHVMKRSLYGLCQNPRNWFNAINDSLKDVGFTATTFAPCVYTSGISDTVGMLTLHVDDLMLLGGEHTGTQGSQT